MAATQDLSEFEKDPRLFLFTSLTAGSSHTITATSRMETILKANKIPFQAIDTATDEKARRLWQRRARDKKLPGLVKDGFVIGDLNDVEEWNEFGELKENIGDVPASHTAPASGGIQGVNTAPPISVVPSASASTSKPSQPTSIGKAPSPLVDHTKFRPLPGAAEIAARNKPLPSLPGANESASQATMTSNASPTQKEAGINAAKGMMRHDHPALDHLSAPASRIHSGTATPQPEAVHGEKGDEATTTTTHRGSEVEEAPSSEVVEDAKRNPLPETAQKDHASSITFKGAGADNETLEKKAITQQDEVSERTQEQDAKAGGNAAHSVED